MRYKAQINNQLEGWDIIDTHQWTTEADEDPENIVVGTVWDQELLSTILTKLNENATSPKNMPPHQYQLHLDNVKEHILQLEKALQYHKELLELAAQPESHLAPFLDTAGTLILLNIRKAGSIINVYLKEY